MKSLTISVGVPTYNRSKYVVRAIQSVLAQTYPNIEVIVSDNASTDDTAESVLAIRDQRVLFNRQKTNLGMTGNFNACLERATGDLFIMLSDDDVLEPTCLERLSAPFRSEDETRDDIGVVWCPVTILNSTGEKTYTTAPGPPQEPGWALVEGLFRGTRGPRFCSMLVRRAEAVSAGGYRPEHGPICDVGNWSQIAVSHATAICIAEPLAGYTVHQASVTSQPDGALWQRSGERITSDLVTLLRQRGDTEAARRIQKAGSANTTNLIVTVMLQQLGKPGWIRYWLSEAVRAPKYLFGRTAWERALRDGWKVLRLRGKVKAES